MLISPCWTLFWIAFLTTKMTCCLNIPETPQPTIDDIPYALYSEDGVYMVKVVNICDLLTDIYGEDYWGNWDIDYDTSRAAVIAWCKKHNSYYYSAARENFKMFIALREAIEAGNDTVVVEDLS